MYSGRDHFITRKRDHFITLGATISSPYPSIGRDHFITLLWKVLHRNRTGFPQRFGRFFENSLQCGGSRMSTRGNETRSDGDEKDRKVVALPVKPEDPFRPDPADRAYMTKFLIQVTLPHRQPSGSPEAWSRKNGSYSLVIRPGLKELQDGTFQRLPYPSGSIPRLLLLWITREAVLKGERRLQLGNSLPSFMKNIGLNPDNGSLRSLRSDRKRLHDQMTNLFQSQIKFGFQNDQCLAWQDLSVTSRGSIWWDFYSDATCLFDSWIDLGEYFFEALVKAPVPLSLQALREIKNSSLSLDLYAWCVYATYTASKRGEPFEISWARLHQNLGAEYNRVRDFKAKAIVSLQAIQKVYPELRLEESGNGLLIRSSFTPIRPQVYVSPSVTSLVVPPPEA